MSQTATLLPGSVQAAPSGALGFDCNTVLTATTAAAFATSGFTFAVRYLSRTSPQGSGNLTTAEAQTILQAGLAVMAVQHVQAAGWVPSQALGTQYGQAAAANAQAVGLPPGINLWLDLEGVASGTAASTIIDYCNAWFAAVTVAGYVPGLYVGANSGLTSAQLYDDLTCQYYWQSGSSVPQVAVRGYCMVQTISDAYVVDGVAYDKDVTQTDNLGNTPLWLAPV